MVIIMKNILNYYYGIIVDDESINDKGFFSYNNHLFCLYEYKRNTSEVEALSYLNNLMLSMNIPINKIINNSFNQTLTVYNNENYVLIEINYECGSLNNIKFVESFNDKRLDILKRNNWGYLWSMKVDYIEYQIKHIKNSYPLINESINYYLGMAENAISYFNMLDLSGVPLYLEHRRVNISCVYNPIELVIDYKTRDIGEYLKNSFINKKMNIVEIKEYLKNLNLNNMDYLLLYVRMIYPSFYFDIYEKIINNGEDEKELLKIINLSSSYERMLYEVYLFIKNKTNIIGVEWINRKFQ